MKKLITCASLLLAASLQTVMGIQARRDVIKTVTQPDGTTLEVKISGDERAHFYATTDGIPVLRDLSGRFCYATVDATGAVTPSATVARNVSERSGADAAYASAIDTRHVLKALQSRQSPVATTAARRAASQSSEIGLSDVLFPHWGDVNALVILVQYSDVKFSMDNPAEYYADFLNGDNFTRDKGTGSCRRYFRDASNDQFRPTFDVYGPVTIRNMATYGANDVWGYDLAPEDMVIDACKALDSTINFADYDTDGDGYVDNIYIIYAGKGEASYGSEDSVWPHQWELSAAGKSLTLDGKKIDHYGCCNEYDKSRPAGIGTFCHEFSHVMGLPDLYTTDYGYDAVKLTPGDWSVLDYGPYNNDGRTPPTYSIFERNAMGWIEPIILTKDPATIELPNILDSNKGAIALTSSKNEFFLFENRQQTGWDAYLPGHGMLVWHIDFNAAVWTGNKVNNTATHQYVDIEEACGRADNESTSIMAGYAFPGTSRVTSFTDATKPAMTTWSGKGLDMPITGITENKGVITFDVCGGMVELPAPAVTASAVNAGGFTLTWQPVDMATSYGVKVADNAGNVVLEAETAETTYEVSRLKHETAYTATVTAKRANSESAPSEAVSVTTGEFDFTLAVPQTAETAVEPTEFTASWEAVPGATEYLLTVMSISDKPLTTVSTNFGSGSSLSLPTGWTSTSSKTYGATSTGYFGQAAPSLKLDSHMLSLTTEVFADDVQSFSCWARLAGVTSGNYFELQARQDASASTAAVTSDDESWTLIATQLLTTTGTVYTFNDFPAGMRQVRVVFFKEYSGNMALDDVSVATGGKASGIHADYDRRTVGAVTSHTITGLAPSTYTYTVMARDAAGRLSLESDPVEVTVDGKTGIVAPEFVEPEAASEIYDLRGVAVSGQLAPGIYIRRTGAKVEKIVIR